jgi:peptidoglycan/LPS O-acetylase OafA/YrhL
MHLNLSLYLDVIRFLAAVGVFLSHISYDPITSNVFWGPLGRYGPISVTVFFVLSGYVIAHVSATREKTARDYFISRLSRLYSVVFPTLILTFVFDKIGMAVNPEFYEIRIILWKPESWVGYISSVLFLNEYQIFGFHGISPGTNGPYWSLSFEATYYLIAGVVLFAPLRFSLPVALVVLLFAGKTISALLPLWGLGFMLYRYGSKLALSRYFAIFAFIGSALMLALLPFIFSRLPSDNFGHYFPWGREPFNRNLLLDYATAGIFGIHILAAKRIMASTAISFLRFCPGIRWFGELTFPLYCIHFPALCFFRAFSPWSVDTWQNAAYLCISVFATIALISPICAYLKFMFRTRLQLLGPAPRNAI